jgi:hypothetical protein
LKSVLRGHLRKVASGHPPFVAGGDPEERREKMDADQARQVQYERGPSS